MAKTWRNPNQPRRGDCMGFLKELKEAHKENNEEKIAERIATIQKECDEELFSEAIRLNDKYIKEKIRRRDQKEKDDAEAVESLRMMNIAEWRPRIESMKKYIRRGKTFNDWAREDPWAQKTVCKFVKGIPTRVLNNSVIDEIWIIASEEVEKETVTESEPEPETAALKSKKRKRVSKKKRKKKKKSIKKTKKKKNTKKKY